MRYLIPGTCGAAVLVSLMAGTAASVTARGAAQQPTPPSNLSDGDFTIGPPYADAPELTVKDGVPKGTIYQFTMKSEDSKTYSGIAKTQPGAVVPYARNVAVYVPAQYVAGTAAPFIVAQDGTSPKYLDTLPVILDNMIHEKRLPVLIAVMVNHGGGDAQGYVFAEQAGHVDRRVVDQTLSDALLWLWKGYPIK